MKYKRILTKEENKAIRDYLSGKQTARGAGKNMGCSHQQVINRVAALCREWFQEGKLKFK